MKKLLIAAAVALGMSLPTSAQTSYKPVELTYLDWVKEMPNEGKIDEGDIRYYQRPKIVETKLFGMPAARRAVDMMWKYGTTENTADEYKMLCGKNVYIMMNEISLEPTHDVFDIYHGHGRYPENYHSVDGLSSIIMHIKHLRPLSSSLHSFADVLHLYNLIEWAKAYDYPDCICSHAYAGTIDQDRFYSMQEYFNTTYTNTLGTSRFVEFHSISNLNEAGNLVANISKELPNDRSVYCSLSSLAPSEDGKYFANINKYVAVGMCHEMDYHVLPAGYDGSKFPYGFDNNFVVGSNPPVYLYRSTGGALAESGNCESSFAASNLSGLAYLCTHLWPGHSGAEVMIDMRETDVWNPVTYPSDPNPELDNMTTYVRGIDCGLYFKYRDMPRNLPTDVTGNGPVKLERGLYPGILFDGPGVEVKAGNEWIAVTASNISRIKKLDPMALECRFNPVLATQQGFSGYVDINCIPIDDEFTALDLDKTYRITFTGVDAIDTVTLDSNKLKDGKYEINGHIYIVKDGKYYLTNGIKQ